MELARLIASAESADPGHRIEWRDGIAAHGARAIEGVRPWLASSTLAPFAIRVIETAGANGEATLASRVLRAARKTAAAGAAGDIDWALQRLRAATRPPRPAPSTPAATTPARPARREQPRLGAAIRRRGR